MLNNKRGKDSRQAGMTEGGLTLIEMMIALVVLLLVSLAMMQTALVSIDANMTNVLRDEAVGIAEDTMSQLRNTTPVSDLTAGTSSVTVPRSFRNIAIFNYTVKTTIADSVTNIGTDKYIDITVTWDWKEKTAAGNNPYTHTISTLLRSS